MRLLAALAIVVCVAAVPTPLISDSQYTGMSAAFQSWASFHGKTYASEEEFNHRLSIFTENAIRVEQHNAQKLSWTMALTHFADMTTDEFVALQKLRSSTIGTEHSSAPLRYTSRSVSLPESVDWRGKLVTPVKNQGQCGSCWAFSTVVSIEGQSANKTGSLVSYSEQDLVDCVKNQQLPGDSEMCCDGCNGGLMDSAFAYLIAKQDGKDDTEAAYPYKGVDGTCSFSDSNAGPGVVLNFTDIAKGDEDSLKDAVANVGPISVAVDANLFWQLYGGGVFTPLFCNKDTLNHGVAVVGYGTDGGKAYWIIKNSWGAGWGEQGYMRIIAGKNECGVANSAVFPNL